MSLKEFDIAQLGELSNGEAGELFTKLLKELVRDCGNRPMVDKPRELEIKLYVKPLADDYGTIRDVDLDISMKTTTPIFKGTTTRARPDSQGKLLFNDMSQDNPDQMSLDEQEAKNKAEREAAENEAAED